MLHSTQIDQNKSSPTRNASEPSGLKGSECYEPSSPIALLAQKSGFNGHFWNGFDPIAAIFQQGLSAFRQIGKITTLEKADRPKWQRIAAAGTVGNAVDTGASATAINAATY